MFHQKRAVSISLLAARRYDSSDARQRFSALGDDGESGCLSTGAAVSNARRYGSMAGGPDDHWLSYAARRRVQCHSPARSQGAAGLRNDTLAWHAGLSA